MENKKLIPLILLGFSALCFITSGIMNTSQQKVAAANLSPDGGIIGPFRATKRNAVHQIILKQPFSTSGSYNTVVGELLDKDQAVLMSFTKDLYYETGYDSDGAWSESVTTMKTKITYPEPGTYYLRIVSERNDIADNAVSVSIYKKTGSALPFTTAAWLSAAAAVLYILWQRRREIMEVLEGLEGA